MLAPDATTDGHCSSLRIPRVGPSSAYVPALLSKTRKFTPRVEAHPDVTHEAVSAIVACSPIP